MSIAPIHNLPVNYMEALLGTGASKTANSSSSTAAASRVQSGATSFAQMLQELAQLQQTNPAQYHQLTSQISANLHSAAKAAQSDGLSAVAKELSNFGTALSQSVNLS